METNKILEKIKKGEVKMTSRRFFMLKWLTLLVTSLFFLVLSFYIFAYVVFLFVDNGLAYIPLFTQAGLANFIVEIPWTLVLLGLFSIFLFSITSKTFYRLYKKPFVTSFLIVLIIIMISHIVFVESGAMKILKEQAYERHVQLVPDKFLEFRDSQTGSLVVGYIVATTTNSIIVHDRRNQILELFVQEGLQTNTFLIGAHVNAYTQRANEKLYAKSIEIVE